MAKTKRQSQSLSAGYTREQFDATLAKFAAKDAEINCLTAEMEKQIQQLKDEYDDDLNILVAEQKLNLAVLKGYCVQNRADLLPDKKKSFETLFGIVGFQMTPPSLKPLGKLKWEEIVPKVKALLPDYIRTEEEVNKEKLLGDRGNEAVSKLFPELGIKVSQEEKFYVALKKEEVTI